MADDFLTRLARRSGKKKREEEEKAETEKAAKAKKAEEEAKAKPATAPEGGGGYGGAGDAYRKRKTEEMTGDVQPTAFTSSNTGQTGRSTAAARRARDKRLNGVAI